MSLETWGRDFVSRTMPLIECGEYAIMAIEVAALGLVDEGLQPDSAYDYLMRACNHLGCTELDDNPVAGVTGSHADVNVPLIPKDFEVVRKKVEVFHDVHPGTCKAVAVQHTTRCTGSGVG